jgi:hypothetical protein
METGSCLSPSIAALSYATKRADPLTTGTSNKTTIAPLYSFAKGDTISGDKLCLNLLNCLVSSTCDSSGTISAACWCGSATGTDCLDGTNFIGGVGDPTIQANQDNGTALATGPINGSCVIEEENAANTTNATTVATLFGDMANAAGPANELLICLSTKSCNTCF